MSVASPGYSQPFFHEQFIYARSRLSINIGQAAKANNLGAFERPPSANLASLEGRARNAGGEVRCRAPAMWRAGARGSNYAPTSCDSSAGCR